jgi:hypothetical protein
MLSQSLLKRIIPILLVLSTFPVLDSVTRSRAAAREPADSWASWRNRQRAELASLPKPALPPVDGTPVIDRILAAYWAKNALTPPAIVDDRTYARRVYMDVIGLLPTTIELERFIADADSCKREKLIDALLSDKQAYAEHWMSFWNDLLRNDEQTNIDGLRKPITVWLYTSLLENKPLDLFVAELLNPGKNGPDGYLKGVNWRGRVNASQLPPIQAAQNVSQVFLASSLKCASCHDSFINDLKLLQAYGLASFFSVDNLEMHRCDKATGKIVPPQFLFPGLCTIAPNADLEARHRAIAEAVTRPKNQRFARTLVNRLWKRLLGRGLFEPVDDFDSPAVAPELLEWLAYDFMSHDYDAKHTLRQILLSKVYQAPVTRPAPLKPKETPRLTGPVLRKLTSEQYLDAIAQVTEYWPIMDLMKVNVQNPRIREWRHKKPDSLAIALGRPNREQVCTERNQESTVLQSLELVNGSALTSRLEAGAKKFLGGPLGREPDWRKAAKALYERSLGRLPTKEELTVARPLLDAKISERARGLEDFLWLLFMSPEFQFIH